MYGNDPYRARTETSGVAIKPGLRVGATIAAVVGMAGFLACVGTASAAMIMAIPEQSASHYQGPPKINEGLMIIAGLAFLVCILAVYAKSFLGMGWLYRVWSWLPEHERHTNHWKGQITPSTAALFLLIPYFQYYWMFVINCGLCDAMDRMRVARPTTNAAPKGLAIAAGVCQILIPMPVGMILWLMYMKRIETMALEMAATPLPAMPVA